MKRLLAGLVLLLLASVAWAQSPVTATLQNAATTGNGTVLTTTGFTLVGLQIIENGGGDRVVNFEGSQDATNYVALSCKNVATLAIATTNNADSVFACNVGGLNKFRARVSGGTGGTVTVTATVLSNAAGNALSDTISAGALANPTATIGLSVINGSALTAMRSDAAPALSQAIVPRWTGQHIWGTGTAQTAALLVNRTPGNDFEFGHNNLSGYGSTIGAEVGNGVPFICFHCEAGTTNNTYRTRGIPGIAIATSGAANGTLIIGAITTASADNQAPSNLVTITQAGLTTLVGLASTGSATGKTVVCADSSGVLYRSSSGVACAN